MITEKILVLKSKIVLMFMSNCLTLPLLAPLSPWLPPSLFLLTSLPLAFFPLVLILLDTSSYSTSPSSAWFPFLWLSWFPDFLIFLTFTSGSFPHRCWLDGTWGVWILTLIVSFLDYLSYSCTPEDILFIFNHIYLHYHA